MRQPFRQPRTGLATLLAVLLAIGPWSTTKAGVSTEQGMAGAHAAHAAEDPLPTSSHGDHDRHDGHGTPHTQEGDTAADTDCCGEPVCACDDCPDCSGVSPATLLAAWRPPGNALRPTPPAPPGVRTADPVGRLDQPPI